MPLDWLTEVYESDRTPTEIRELLDAYGSGCTMPKPIAKRVRFFFRYWHRGIIRKPDITPRARQWFRHIAWCSRLDPQTRAEVNWSSRAALAGDPFLPDDR